jgi:hypothetical protein
MLNPKKKKNRKRNVASHAKIERGECTMLLSSSPQPWWFTHHNCVACMGRSVWLLSTPPFEEVCFYSFYGFAV